MGENGSVFILDKELVILDRINLSCSTCWSATTENEQIVVSGSDGCVYILEFNDMPRKEDAPLPICEKKSTKDAESKTFTSNNVRYKREDGKIFIEENNEWKFLGYDEKTYDNSFTVELGGKNYELSFNDTDDVYDIASKFLLENKLSLKYKNEIVNFVNKNFKKSKIYKKFEKIDISGIRKMIGQNKILSILERINNDNPFISNLCFVENNIYEIEELLFNTGIPNFVILDICKFLYSKNIKIDISFLFTLKVEEKKDAKAFAYLMTNLVSDSPINLTVLHNKLLVLKDHKLLNFDDLISYSHNYEIYNRK